MDTGHLSGAALGYGPRMGPEDVECPYCRAEEGQPCRWRKNSRRKDHHPRRLKEAKNATAVLVVTGKKTLRGALAALPVADLVEKSGASRRWIIEKRGDVGLKDQRYNRIGSAADARRAYLKIGVETDEVVADRAGKSAATIWRVRKRWGIVTANPRAPGTPRSTAASNTRPPTGLQPDYLNRKRNARRILRVLRAEGSQTEGELRSALGAARSSFIREPLESLRSRGLVRQAGGRWMLDTIGPAEWAVVDRHESDDEHAT